jgi:hypothetical protein
LIPSGWSEAKGSPAGRSIDKIQEIIIENQQHLLETVLLTFYNAAPSNLSWIEFIRRIPG